MRFVTTAIDGVVEVGIGWHDDERGRFGRTFCTREFAEQGLSPKLSQCSVSSNIRRGTVRGFHFQARPHEEAKLVQCVAGRLLDVALDVRPGSATFGKYHAVELAAESGQMLFIPEGCAHAFQTLEDATSLIYYISSPYHPESGCGVAWDDPAIDVPWPVRDAIVSERDRRLPRLVDLQPFREKPTGLARGPNA